MSGRTRRRVLVVASLMVWIASAIDANAATTTQTAPYDGDSTRTWCTAPEYCETHATASRSDGRISTSAQLTVPALNDVTAGAQASGEIITSAKPPSKATAIRADVTVHVSSAIAASRTGSDRSDVSYQTWLQVRCQGCPGGFLSAESYTPVVESVPGTATEITDELVTFTVAIELAPGQKATGAQFMVRQLATARVRPTLLDVEEDHASASADATVQSIAFSWS